MSVRQGVQVSEFLESRNMPWNRAWNGAPVMIGEDRIPMIALPDGARLTLLSPRQQELRRFGNLWMRQLKRMPSASGPQSTEADEESAAVRENAGRRCLVFATEDDSSWARRIERQVEKQAGKEKLKWVRCSESQAPPIADGDTVVVLVSPSALASKWLVAELDALTLAANYGQIKLGWILVKACGWQNVPLSGNQSLNDVNRPLDTLVGNEGEAAIQGVATLLISLTFGGSDARSTVRRGASETGTLDVERLANASFAPDMSVPNGASIAFLLEVQDRALLIGGDARPDVLVQSIRALLSERRQPRLRVDAFVVPHGGSDRNLSRELLDLLECDRYLFSTNGQPFDHPNRETVARILTFGRTDANSSLTLVFNYRTKSTAMWANQALQEKYRYQAVYPQMDSGGIKVGLA